MRDAALEYFSPPPLFSPAAVLVPVQRQRRADGPGLRAAGFNAFIGGSVEPRCRAAGARLERGPRPGRPSFSTSFRRRCRRGPASRALQPAPAIPPTACQTGPLLPLVQTSVEPESPPTLIDPLLLLYTTTGCICEGSGRASRPRRAVAGARRPTRPKPALLPPESRRAGGIPPRQK